MSQLGDFHQQVFSQSAANAAIGHLDQFLIGSAELRRTSGDLLSVDVHFAHVVHNHGDLQALAIGEYVIQQRCLAGSQKAREHGDG